MLIPADEYNMNMQNWKKKKQIYHMLQMFCNFYELHTISRSICHTPVCISFSVCFPIGFCYYVFMHLLFRTNIVSIFKSIFPCNCLYIYQTVSYYWEQAACYGNVLNLFGIITV